MLEFHSFSQNDTERIAAEFAVKLHGGEVIAFFGGLGMGKTAFVRGLARGLGNPAFVCSPTFAIVNDYGGRPCLYHFDMYRIADWSDLESIGFWDYMNADSVLCIEWSENIENALPEACIKIEITKGEAENERIIKIF